MCSEWSRCWAEGDNVVGGGLLARGGGKSTQGE